MNVWRNASLLMTAAALAVTAAMAQERPSINVFFGFDYVLTPLAAKWSCGGDPTDDLAVLDALIAAFPQDAARAELSETIDLILHVAHTEMALENLVGGPMTPAFKQDLCAHALPLDISWVTPQGWANDTAKASPEQEAAWSAFFKLLENR